MCILDKDNISAISRVSEIEALSLLDFNRTCKIKVDASLRENLINEEDEVRQKKF